jgi:hypothetical protein
MQRQKEDPHDVTLTKESPGIANALLGSHHDAMQQFVFFLLTMQQFLKC